ncbi:MAG: YdeI/OmpD-associated family protein [Chloroflexi bacterium]|nr:YdeI/OmpD-associated family protein [Chloroflexota bacterium]
MSDELKVNLTRPIYPIPDFVEEALNNHGLTDAYCARPAYQQNDYIGWINRAKRPETKLKRLNQMLDELRTGGIYMRMNHPPSRRT